MNNEELLLRTLDDLSLRINSEDEYEVLLASTLIRKLFLDDYPLIDKVNQKYRLKFEFEFVPVVPPKILGVPELEYWVAVSSLDPYLAPVESKVIKTSRSIFFSTIIGKAEKHEYSVREIIKFVANIMGGVHAGVPKTQSEEALNKLREVKLFSNLSLPLEQIKSISRIILKTLRPLKYKILNLERFEKKPGISIHLEIALYPSEEGRTNFIGDLGLDERKNRLSIFVNDHHQLCFQIFDNMGNQFKINAGFEGSSFVYGRFFYLSYELAMNDQETFLSIDTGTWNYIKIFNNPVKFIFQDFNYVIGSNYLGTEFTNMALKRQLVASTTLDLKEKEGVYNHFLYNIRKGEGSLIRFEGHKFMHSKGHPNFPTTKT